MEQLVVDLEAFWDYEENEDVPPNATTFKDFRNCDGSERYAEADRNEAVHELIGVRKALRLEFRKLHRRYWWPSDNWGILSHLTNAPLLWVDARPQIPEEAARYILYLPALPYVKPFSTLQEVKAFLTIRPPSESTTTHAVAFSGEHYSALYPPDMVPNYAGPNRLEPRE